MIALRLVSCDEKNKYQLTEKELIKGCQIGKPEAQKELYRLYSPRLFGVCLRYAASYQEAEDFLQEGFIRIYRNLYKYKSTGSFNGWLHRVVINVALEDLRKNKKRQNQSNLDEVIDISIDSEDVFDTFGARDIMLMVQKLPNGYRTVFNLYVVEGYSHYEIGEMLGINENTSKSQLSRAKAALRKLLEKVI